jgi:hypothetical protein
MPTGRAPYDGPERRVNRLTLPACERCESSRTWVVGRTDELLYVRCSDCTHVWSVKKPGPDLPGE